MRNIKPALQLRHLAALLFVVAAFYFSSDGIFSSSDSFAQPANFIFYCPLQSAIGDTHSLLTIASALTAFALILFSHHDKKTGSLRFAAPIALVLVLTACGSAPQFFNPAPTNPHEQNEGQTLGANKVESVYAGALCPANAPVRAYNVVAINVEITLNRFLDYDPNGRMYVLAENLARVRDEEARNKLARADKGDPAVSTGLQNDAIQPLTLRANQGECLRVTLRNDLKNDETTSLHLHGSSWHLKDSG